VGLSGRNFLLSRGCKAGVIIVAAVVVVVVVVAEYAVASLASDAWWPWIYRDERVLV